MGCPDRQLRDLGHRRHFPRLRPQSRSPRSAAPKSPPSGSAQYYNERLQPAQPAAAAADHARPGARARARPAIPRPAHRRDDAEREGARHAARHLRRRDRQPHPQRPELPRRRTASSIRSRFEQIIRQAGFTEGALRRTSSARSCCAGRSRRASAGDVRAPATALEAINHIRNEKRNVDYSRFGPAQAGDVAAPTPNSSRKYFEERKALFRAPEYRKITVLTFVARRAGQTRRGPRRRRQGLLRAAQGAIRQAREARDPPDHVSQGGGRRRRARQDRQRRKLRRHRQGARPEAGGHRSRHGRQGRSDRSGGRGSRLCAQARRGQPAGRRPLRHGAVDGRQDRAGRAEELRRGRAADQAGDRRAAQARSKLGDLRDKIEDEQASGATLAETAKKLGLTATVIRGRRSLRPRPRRQADRRAAEGARRGRVRLRQRCRRRQRGAAAADRRLPLFRRHRHHALARAHARRGQGQGRRRAGATTRSPSGSPPRRPTC